MPNRTFAVSPVQLPLLLVALKTVKWFFPALLLLLTGCSIRSTEPQNGTQKLTDEQLREAAKLETIPFDPTNVSLAEITVQISTMANQLAAIGKNHSYHNWTDVFINDSIAEVKTLAKGEILDSSMHTQTGNGLEEVKIQLIKKDPSSVIIRLTTSNPDLARKLQADLNSADNNPTPKNKSPETLRNQGIF